jgi:NitT/TauT family transport system ATP-binding protein
MSVFKNASPRPAALDGGGPGGRSFKEVFGISASVGAGADQDDSFISLRGLSKSFTGRRGTLLALAPVDLDVRDGEFVSIVGPSGCGKSTLMMLLSGLVPASAGTIRVGGKPVTGPNADIGIVFQQDVLLEWRTALENIVLQAEIRGLDKAAAVEEAHRLLAMVGLDGFAGAYPHELSGGMRQRVSICRALLHRPPLLVMDEPFGALDALTRDQLQVDLLRLCAERRMTVIFVTHSIIEAVFLSDRVVVMSPRPGRVETIIPIDLPRPRRLAMRDTPAFMHHNHAVTDLFKSLGVLREEDE